MNRYKLSRAGVDVNQGLKRLDNDKELYEMLMQKYWEVAHYEALKKAMEQGDMRQAFQQAHALKGMAGNLSFERLHTALIPMVEELRSGSMEKAQELFGEVTEAYDVLIGVLRGDS